jgi:hypothetical protein
MSDTHDFAAQRRDTFEVFAGMARENVLPDEADIDYQFVPSDQADWDGFETALVSAEFGCTRIDASPENHAYLQATLHDQPLSALTIWMGEEMATKLALAHGFLPDGWGFYSNTD